MRLRNKVAVITGASSGIGRATAIMFAHEGAKVIAASRDISKISEVVDAIERNGGQAMSIKVDISDPHQVSAMVENAIQRFGKIDILVNNAGITNDQFIEKMTISQWESVINTNLNGTFYCIHEIVPHMIKNNYGRIINTASIAGEKGAVAQSNYAASKSAIIGLTLSLAQELGSKGITVNAVSPGLISTTMLDSIPVKIKERAIKNIPLGRFGVPEEIASSYVFLASDESGYCNGTILDVNGGYSI